MKLGSGLMPVFWIVCAAAGLVYWTVQLSLVKRVLSNVAVLSRARRTQTGASVSVIVPARNEEADLLSFTQFLNMLAGRLCSETRRNERRILACMRRSLQRGCSPKPACPEGEAHLWPQASLPLLDLPRGQAGVVAPSLRPNLSLQHVKELCEAQ